jgi:hypothetical protein
MKWSWIDNLPTSQALSALTVILWAPTAICALCNVTVAEWWPSTLVTLTFASVLHASVKRFTYKGTVENGSVSSPQP